MDSGRLDAEQFIQADLKDVYGQVVYRVVLQVAPVGRLVRFEHIPADE